MSDDTFKVEAKVTITSNAGGYSGQGQTISYDQTFNVPARSFTEVAKILGAFNDAMGSIKDNGTQTAINEAYKIAKASYGEQSSIVTALAPYVN